MDAGSSPASGETGRSKYSHRLDRHGDRSIRGGYSLNCSSEGHLFAAKQPASLPWTEGALVTQDGKLQSKIVDSRDAWRADCMKSANPCD